MDHLPYIAPARLRAMFGCATEDDWRSDDWQVWELSYGDRDHCPEWVENRGALLAVWVADHPGARRRFGGVWTVQRSGPRGRAKPPTCAATSYCCAARSDD